MITVRFAILLHLISPFSSTLFILFIPINSFSFVCKTLSSLHWTSSCTRLSKTVWWRFHHLSPSMRERPFTQLPISLISRYMSVLTPLTLTPSTFFPPQFLFPFYSSSVLQTLPSIPNYWIPFLSFTPLSSFHFHCYPSFSPLPFSLFFAPSPIFPPVCLHRFSLWSRRTQQPPFTTASTECSKSQAPSFSTTWARVLYRLVNETSLIYVVRNNWLQTCSEK